MAEHPSFAIMGSGGVGGYFGARLAAAGIPVTFIARGAHLAAMREDGLHIESTKGDLHVKPVQATDDPGTVGPVDIVLVAVKLWDTESAARACRPLIGPGTAAISLQNGVDAEEQLAAILGPEHVMGGVAEIMATIAAPGHIRHTSPFTVIRFGELDGTRTPRAEATARAFAAAGIDHELSTDIRRIIWQKFVFLVGLSALTALTRKSAGAVRSDPDTRALLEQVMAEVIAVAAAKGVTLQEDFLADRMAFIDGLPEGATASMANDLARGNRLELDWLSGAVVRIGRETGVAAPANQFVYAALKLHAAGPGDAAG